MNILQHRLQNQQISKHQFDKPEDVVRWFGAMQAQDYAMAKWATGLRMEKAKDSLIEQALNEGRILRTHVLRPTWHFVHPEDIRWMLKLTGPRVMAGMSSRLKQLELNDKLFNKTTDIILKALEGHRHLTRPELMALINKAGINTDENRSAHIAMHAELNGLICSGARKGKDTTYALMDERITKTKEIDRDEALAKLTLRYFTAHGPATIHDFAWWSGLTLTDVKRGVEMVDNDLYFKDIGGVIYWHASIMPDVIKPPKGAVLLPNFDEYTVGYINRLALADASHINTRGNVLFSNVMLINGEIKGTWRRTIIAKGLKFEPQLFKKPSQANELALQTAVKKYAKFLALALVS